MQFNMEPWQVTDDIDWTVRVSRSLGSVVGSCFWANGTSDCVCMQKSSLNNMPIAMTAALPFLSHLSPSPTSKYNRFDLPLLLDGSQSQQNQHEAPLPNGE